MPGIGELISPDLLRFRAQTLGMWVQLTDAATIATDASLSDFFYVTLGGNRTLGAPTNLPPAATLHKKGLLYRIRQDGTGTRTLAFNAVFRFPGAVTPTITATANETSYLAFIYNEIDSTWDQVGQMLDLRA